MHSSFALNSNLYYISYIAITLYFLYRNELITSTWLEDPDDRPTFSQIVKNLSSICNFTEVADEEESIKDNEDTAENSGYIKIVPT